MIKDRIDYAFYIKADAMASNIPECIKGRIIRMLKDPIWKYQKMLRKTEYVCNCKKSFIWRPLRIFYRYRLFKYGLKLGFLIPPNTFGPGLSIAHFGPIIVNAHARIGENCRIHHCVTIGTEAGCATKCPVIGDNAFIGPGVQIFGDIRIADDVAIGANSVVNKSFLEKGITIAGVPAKKVSDKGSLGLYGRSTDALRNYNMDN